MCLKQPVCDAGTDFPLVNERGTPINLLGMHLHKNMDSGSICLEMWRGELVIGCIEVLEFKITL